MEDHSDNFQAMLVRTESYGKLENADGTGSRTGDCGDTINMYLALSGDRLKAVHFTVNGCLNTVACGNAVSYLMEGRTVDEGWQLSPQLVSDFLQTLPKDHFHCAELAVGAFYKALADCKGKAA